MRIPRALIRDALTIGMSVSFLLCAGMLGAHAQAPAVIAPAAAASFPIGDLLKAFLSGTEGLAVLGMSALVYNFAPPALRELLTVPVITRAVDYAFAAVEGATKGQMLSLTTSNQVLLEAENYLLTHAPLMASWLDAALRPRIIAHLSHLGALPAHAFVSAPLGTAEIEHGLPLAVAAALTGGTSAVGVTLDKTSAPAAAAKR